jgi:hypothetical protein
VRRFRRLRPRIIAAARAERSVITATEADGHNWGDGFVWSGLRRALLRATR